MTIIISFETCKRLWIIFTYWSIHDHHQAQEHTKYTKNLVISDPLYLAWHAVAFMKGFSSLWSGRNCFFHNFSNFVLECEYLSSMKRVRLKICPLALHISPMIHKNYGKSTKSWLLTLTKINRNHVRSHWKWEEYDAVVIGDQVGPYPSFPLGGN